MEGQNDLIGEQVREFQIISELGAGGYGVVYLAHDTNINRDVAIKVILPQYANKPEFIQNFEAEARLVAQLEHLNIIPLYSYWQDDNSAFLVMRYIRGGSLRGMLAKQGALPLNRILRIVEQIAEALSVAHEAGVVHRDLKPDNILIDERGNAYLTDFGIAKQIEEDNQSATDAIKGTFAYLSPEQIQQTQISPQTDIYAFGIMLYEMLAGQHPFHETPIGMMVVKHLNENLPDIRTVRDNLDGDITDIIYKATAKDPEERYASTLELVADLKQAVDGTTAIPSAPIQQQTIEKKKPSSPQERNRHAMLENVRKFWVEGVLENSLHDAAMIDLGMKPESGAVDNPWDTLIRTPSGEETLTDDSISHVFDRMNGKLLILGDPGSGKTTTLLTLARDLLFRAELDEQHPIPVVFNLSSWSENQPPLTEWLVEELNSKYQVPRKVGQKWVEDDELLLLLDGLDEVAENVRDACVQAINTYRSEHGFVDVVVCSRIKDYEALTGQLKLNGAIVIQPLDDAQIVQYLDGLGADVAVVRELIVRDTQLRELAQSPLMLSIMVLAYRGKSADDIPDFDDVEAQRQHLFEVYVQRMFDRRIGEMPYTKEDTRHYLSWLAGKMKQHALSVFHIEGLQPNWLPEAMFKRWHWYPRLAHSLTFGILAFVPYLMLGHHLGLNVVPGSILYGLAYVVFGLNFTSPARSRSVLWNFVLGTIYFLSFYVGTYTTGSIGLLVALALGMMQGITAYSVSSGFIERGNDPNVIRPIDQLTFSLRSVRPRYGPFVSGLWGIMYTLCLSLTAKIPWTTQTLTLICFSGFIVGNVAILQALGMTSTEARLRTKPNQGIKNSGLNTLKMFPGFLIPSVLIWLPCLIIVFDMLPAISVFLIFGLPMTWGYAIVFCGGYPALQHVLLRWLLQRECDIPPNLMKFLDYASSLILVRKVGGGYIFIHRYLLEYFADLETDD